MRYKSEMMVEILKSPEAQKIIDYVSPIYEDSYIGLWIFEVNGRQLDEMLEWCTSMVAQVVPQTATWSLDYYESEYVLPTNKALPLHQRREAIITKMQQRAPMNPKKLSQLIKNAIGFDARIDECTAKNTFTIIISAVPGMVDLDKVSAVVDPAKPSHLIYVITYEQGISGSIYWGCKACKGGILTARQVN